MRVIMPKFMVIKMSNGHKFIMHGKSAKAIECRLPERGLGYIVQPYIIIIKEKSL